MTRAGLPRVVIAGLAGDTGKTVLTLGLARALARRGLRVAPFKNGPDFIDAAWLGAAARAPGRNLDTYLMPAATITGSMQRAAQGADLALVEGKRGLYDGADVKGSHSTAELAKLIRAPVVLVVKATKVTRTVAALVLGCKTLDPEVALAGVILNRIGNGRQEGLIRRALADATGIPVLGTLPPLERQPLPSRHLGLVSAAEHPERELALEALADAVVEHVDLDAMLAVASTAGAMPGELVQEPPRLAGRRVRIGLLRDAAFSFYYPENIEALEAAGAQIVPISPLVDGNLPAVDALYAGGGFPEEHLGALAANEPLRKDLAAAIADGLPVWAECGGLMYLARSIARDGREYPMVGALPISVEHTSRPQGHGYMAATVDRANPFFPVGTRLLGHEFHHSQVVRPVSGETALAVERGVGLGRGRDGLCVNNVVATYMHLHALGTTRWAEGMVRAALRRAQPEPRHPAPRSATARPLAPAHAGGIR